MAPANFVCFGNEPSSRLDHDPSLPDRSSYLQPEDIQFHNGDSFSTVPVPDDGGDPRPNGSKSSAGSDGLLDSKPGEIEGTIK